MLCALLAQPYLSLYGVPADCAISLTATAFPCLQAGAAAASAAAAALKRTLDRCHTRVEDLKNFRNVTFTGVFSHRFRWVGHRVAHTCWRKVCAAATLGACVLWVNTQSVQGIR